MSDGWEDYEEFVSTTVCLSGEVNIGGKLVRYEPYSDLVVERYLGDDGYNVFVPGENMFKGNNRRKTISKFREMGKVGMDFDKYGFEGWVMGLPHGSGC